MENANGPESATSSLEDLSARLSEILEQREQEREQHARERGELKEEMTALQMDLELAQADMQELQGARTRARGRRGQRNCGTRRAAAAPDAAEAAGEALHAARDELQAGLDALILERDGLAQRMAELEAQPLQTDARRKNAQPNWMRPVAAETGAAETIGAPARVAGPARRKAELLGRAGAEGEQAQKRIAELETRPGWRGAGGRRTAAGTAGGCHRAADRTVGVAASRPNAIRKPSIGGAGLAELQHALAQAQADNETPCSRSCSPAVSKRTLR